MAMPSTSTTISKYCTKSKPQHISISLAQDAKIHFIGCPPAAGEKVLLYLYGGGYNLPILDAHISFSLKCPSQASQRISHNSHAHYPLPYINQASHRRTKTHLITHLSEQIITAAESAGGHLTLNLLSHLLHPFKDLENISLLLNSGKLGG
jgi:acetyl esterase/lipase